MLQFSISKKIISLILLVLFTSNTWSQTTKTVRVQPKWWWGVSGATNINTYRGTTQMVNADLSTPTAFHKGKGIKPYASVLMEYRPNKVVGFMLNVAYDGRGGRFDEVVAPCNCPANLSTNLAYVAIEPSLRIAPFASALYLFAGPTFGINIAKQFLYTQEKQNDVRADWKDIRNTVISAQAGLGIDIPVSRKNSETQMTISPFASFITDLGNAPRTVETWSIYTVRTGIALKFGTGKKLTKLATPAPPIHDTIYKYIHDTVTVKTNTPVAKEVIFSVRAPKAVLSGRPVKETFPIRNSVFFDKGSSEIPGRYILKTKTQANSFQEAQLQENQPENLNSGRAVRQMNVYYNILNILGARLKANPNSTILLSGASEDNPKEGKLMAENVKKYLVSIFDIAGTRISTEGRSKPVIPSEQPGATKWLTLLKEGDRRVDITSTSSELLLQVGGKTSAFLKPIEIKTIQTNPLDSYVLFNVNAADANISSWTVELTDQLGKRQYFGPYIKDQAAVAGNTILGTNAEGHYAVRLVAQNKKGTTIIKESSVDLVKITNPDNEGLRYSILFDFDKSTSIASYEKFLIEVVAPLIPNNSIVTIHGHTDVIGDINYNMELSNERALSTQKILVKALANTNKNNVKFEATGFGEDESTSPFNNLLPEERFYNRTVIIDIIPNK